MKLCYLIALAWRSVFICKKETVRDVWERTSARTDRHTISAPLIGLQCFELGGKKESVKIKWHHMQQSIVSLKTAFHRQNCVLCLESSCLEKNLHSFLIHIQIFLLLFRFTGKRTSGHTLQTRPCSTKTLQSSISSNQCINNLESYFLYIFFI